jgi:hypothetical protein
LKNTQQRGEKIIPSRKPKELLQCKEEKRARVGMRAKASEFIV